MGFLSKFKETAVSVLPIVAVVTVLNFTVAPLGEAFILFLTGSVFLLIGLSVFLAGTEIGMSPVGEKLGSVLAGKKNVVLIMAVGFCIGFAVTYAEPDVSVLASQVHGLNPEISEEALRLFIALGLGIFIDVGFLRILLNVKLKWVFAVFYGVIFVLVAVTGQKMASISFDASGATTGPLAVPFILAMGLGVSSSSTAGEENSFGLTGIASIGPVTAVCLMSVFFSGSASSGMISGASDGSTVTLGKVLLEMITKTARGFLPLVALIIVLQIFLLHFPRIKFTRICLGMLYGFVGIVIFLTGAEYGFAPVGRLLGNHIGSVYPPVVTIAVALALGAIVVCAEPAVWVLTEQVEQVTAGRIGRRLVMLFLALGVSAAVCLAIIRIMFDINYLWFVYVGVGLSLILTFFCPPLFTGIAFDSGGVASGPMSTSFLLSFALGVSGSAEMGFGLVGMIAIAPLIAIQILGVIFRIKSSRTASGRRRRNASET